MTGDSPEPQDPAVPAGLDVTTPSQARIYDVLLGGKDNFAADRAAAEVIIRNAPDVPAAARENRAFLGRAARYCVEQGIRQFLDIGTGLPSQGNVHEVVLPLAPQAHIVYVDNDPVVLTHARALLELTAGTTVIQADLREPEKLVEHPELRALIDFDRPVAILLAAVLHFASDEQARRALAVFRELVVPGSHLVISHVTIDNDPERGAAAKQGWKNTGDGIRSADRMTFERYFDGYTLVEPGVVWLPEWRPVDPEAAERAPRWAYAAVGRR